MCGRIANTVPRDAMVNLFAATPSNNLPQGDNYNLCPTQTLAVCAYDEVAGRRLRPMRWGFVPHWYKTPTDGPLLINARAETIAEKPAFREACRSRRCLIAISGFYEWERPAGGQKLPWYVTRADGAPMVLAGIWQDWERDDHAVTSCAVVTCAANSDMARIHHRLPVILGPDEWSLWLGEAGLGAARLMKAVPDGTLKMHRVSTAVNSNRASGPELIEPWTDPLEETK